LQNFVILSIVSIVILGLFVIADVNFSEAGPPPPVPEFRDVTGNGNNVANPTWGNAGENLIRDLTMPNDDVALSNYGDGLSTPAGTSRPSARVISNAIFDQSFSVPDPSGTTDLFWVWGQFVDHDIDLTGGASPSEPFDIPVPLGDPVFDPMNTGINVISMSRSLHDLATGTAVSNPRQQINEITSYHDASNIYGSDLIRANNLRFGMDGKLNVTQSNEIPESTDLLPLNIVGEDNANAGPIPAAQLFLAGDVRANEQAALTALHTLFVREHNRLAAEIQSNNPGWNDERIYQEAKLLVEGELQWITYNEFLTVLLGPNFTPDPFAYDPLIKAQIANEFSTEAYRYGHDAISSEVERIDPDTGNEFIDGNGIGHLSLVQAFFNPNWIKDNGIDEILLGVSLSPGEKIDHLMVDELRNLLFGPPGSPGLDLAALDIQRGRDHGIPDYNAVRVAYGLAPVVFFSDITSDVALQQTLETQYGTVDNIDLWVGGLSEDLANGSMLGELFSTIIKLQFETIRDGDRLYYENRGLSQEQLNIIEDSYLSDVIMRNTKISSMQDNVFLMPSSAVGGHMIPVDTTTLMLAGAQYTAVWLIPVLVSAIGFGIVILRKY